MADVSEHPAMLLLNRFLLSENDCAKGDAVLRIHFTADDLANTRIAADPDPLWELALSGHQLRLPGHIPTLQGWKRRVAGLLHPGGPARARVALSLATSPPRGYFPDFLTPFEAADGFGAGLQAVLSTPKSRLRKEIASLSPPGQGLGPQVDSIRQGQAKGLRELAASMEHYHQMAIAPIWKEITEAVHADRAGRARDLIDGGWTRVLAKLHPTATFQNNVLQIDSWAADGDRDLHLAGRGLLLIPSYFKEQRQLMVLADNELPPVLLYPIGHAARLAAHAQHLAALIGRTRTDVLEATTSSATTSAIAACVRVSLPSASKHLSVLRGVGLVQSVRVQNTVRHTATGLGRKLLAGTDT